MSVPKPVLVYEKVLSVYVKIVVILNYPRGRGGPYCKSFYKIKCKYCIFKNKLIDTDNKQIGGYQRGREWGEMKWLKGVDYVLTDGD